jgi:hypothetical protein
LNIGSKTDSGLTRMLFSFPRQIINNNFINNNIVETNCIENSKYDSSDDDDGNVVVKHGNKTTTTCNFKIDYKLCFLPGLSDLRQFKESLTSSTYLVELHKDNIFKRAFHQRNIDQYNKILAEEETANNNNNAPPPQTNDKTGKAAAKQPPPPAKGSKSIPIAAPVVLTSFGPMMQSDKFLLNCIQKSLRASNQIRSHGTVKFRLSELLDTSKDVLKKFENLKNKNNTSGEGGKEDDIIVLKVFFYVYIQ